MSLFKVIIAGGRYFCREFIEGEGWAYNTVSVVGL